MSCHEANMMDIIVKDKADGDCNYWKFIALNVLNIKQLQSDMGICHLI
jgi:hypothetical protein